MAKDAPGTQTVPLYNADGSISGYTTPEKAADLKSQGYGDLFSGGSAPAPSAPAPSSDPFSNPEQESGYWDDNSQVTLWDPVAGKYITKTVDQDNLFEYNPGGDKTTWGDVDGKRTLIDTSNPDWDKYGADVNVGDGNFDWTWGADQPAPSRPVLDHGIDRETGGQKLDPDWTPPPPVETLRPGGGGTGDPFDPITGGGGAPPNTVRPDIPKPPTETEIKEWEPFDSKKGGQTWNWDYFAPKQAGDGQWGGYDTDYGVFERYQPGQDSPWGMPDIEGGNENFYQQQFNNLLRDEQGYRTRARAAQMRGAESDAAKSKAIEEGTYSPDYNDMWASMGVTPNQPAEGGGGSSEWELRYGDENSTNAEIISQMMPGFNDQEKVYLNKHMDWFSAPENEGKLAGGYSGAQDFLASNPYQKDKGWTTVLGDLMGGVYGQGLSEHDFGTPYVPKGYASPI